MPKFFRFPWAAQGDRVSPPDAVQADGSLGYNQGFPFDYERANTDPNYKPVPREGMNGVLYDITEAIGSLQTQGVPDWVTAEQNGGVALPYRINALVRHKDKVWRSLAADNTAEPSADGSWVDETAAIPQATEAAFGIAKIATQQQLIAGESDSTIVTPKKLRIGVSYRLTQNGYIAFPDWMGGLILQWGRGVNSTRGPIIVPFPIGFTASKFIEIAVPVVGSPSGWDAVSSNGGLSLNQAIFNRRAGGTVPEGSNTNYDIYWFAAGK